MSKILFIHLAKTGGLSIRKLLRECEQLESFDCLHNNAILHYRNGKIESRSAARNASNWNTYTSIFTMVRHPLSRLQSCYRYFQQGGLNQYRKGPFPQDAKYQIFLQDQAPSFDICCAKLPIVSAQIPHMRPMSDWLTQLPETVQQKTIVGRHETFKQDLLAILKHLGLCQGDIAIPHINGLPHVSLEPDADEQARLHVARFYQADYKMFNYQ